MPAACTSCGRRFAKNGSGAILAHLESRNALCDYCVWLVDHHEVPQPPRRKVRRVN